MKTRFSRRLLSLGMFVGAVGLTTGAFADTSVAVRGDMNQILARCQYVSHADSSKVLHVNVCLKPPSMAALENFVNDVSNPKSPNYRHFLNPTQLGAKFGQPASVVESVKNYLTSQGFTITLSGKSHLNIMADGTVAQVEKAFGTTINEYRTLDPNDIGRPSFYAYTTAPTVPSGIGAKIGNITGLQNYSRPKSGILTLAQARQLYGTAKEYAAGVNGQNRTIAYSNWDGFDPSNLNLYYGDFALPTPAAGVGSNVTIVTVDGGSEHNSQEGEGDLDMQMILGVAPLCNLIVYDGGNNDTDVFTKQQDDDAADVISESWGWGDVPSDEESNHVIMDLIVGQGITYLCSSGDTGTGYLNNDTYIYPDDEPDVLVVGGTEAEADSNGNRLSEIVWDNNYADYNIPAPWGQGVGGYTNDAATSNFTPPFQLLGTPGIPTNIPYRLVPDIAANSGGQGFDDNDEWAFYAVYRGGISEFAGTSCASPYEAGGFGIAEQQLIALGALTADSNGHYRFGRIADLLYSQNLRPDVWFDVISGTSGQMLNGNQAQAGVGWDFATGLGVINFDGFVNSLLFSMSASPTAVAAGSTSTGTVSFAGGAPAGGAQVTLSTASTQVSIPSSVTIPAGSSTASFTIVTQTASSNYSATINGTCNGSPGSATINVYADHITGVSFSPSSIYAGASSTGTVTLALPAPTGGWTVNLSDVNYPGLTVPATVTVPAGATTATFTATSVSATSGYSAVVTATDPVSLVNGNLTVGPSVVLTGFSLNPTTVLGGVSTTGTVTLNETAATGGYLVHLASSNANYVGVPQSVTVAAGSSTGTFTVTTKPYNQTYSATITANDSTVTDTATLTIGGDAITALTLNSATPMNGSSSTGTITLKSAAPTGGWTVKIANTLPSYVGTPTTVTVPAGSTTGTFTITTKAYGGDYTATITASDTFSSQAAVLKVQGDSVTGLSVSPTTVNGGVSSTGTVTLHNAAPAGGWVVNIANSLPSYVGTPATVTVTGGATTASFTITTKVYGGDYAATITASDATTSKSASLGVYGDSITSLVISPVTVTGGTSSKGTITLHNAAPPGGWVVHIASTGTAASGPASVTIAAGATTGTFTITTKTVTVNTPITFTASDTGSSKSAILGIKPGT